jgi:hypothetical protein
MACNVQNTHVIHVPKLHPSAHNPTTTDERILFCFQDFLVGPGTPADLDSLLAVAASTAAPPDPATQNQDSLRKVVLARCVKLAVRGHLPPLAIVKLLQQRDAASYQFAMILPEGSAFVSATPERLFVREGDMVSSEAVAGMNIPSPEHSFTFFSFHYLLLHHPKTKYSLSRERDHSSNECLAQS